MSLFCPSFLNGGHNQKKSTPSFILSYGTFWYKFLAIHTLIHKWLSKNLPPIPQDRFQQSWCGMKRRRNTVLNITIRKILKLLINPMLTLLWMVPSCTLSWCIILFWVLYGYLLTMSGCSHNWLEESTFLA